MAREEKTGARALVSSMEKLLVGFERLLPSTDVDRFTVTEDLVDDPRAFVQEILKDEHHPARCEIFDAVDAEERIETLNELEVRKQEFIKNFGKVLSGAALEAVVDASVKEGVSVETMYRKYLRVEDQIHSFEEEFLNLYGLKIRFSPEALHELARRVLGGSEEALIVCRKIFQNYHHGLKLVMERAGGDSFTIPKEAISNPERFLNEMIQKTYSQQD